jgi:3-hydroxyisobutyrate dehydrogenase-like beta-hydroxyacid dehydrogenase
MLKARVPLLLDPAQQTWFAIRLMHKDIRLVLQAAQALSVPVPSADVANAMLARAEELGYGDRDIASLHEVLTGGVGSAVACVNGSHPEE